MSSSFVLVSEHTGGLNNEVSTSLTPWDILRVPSQNTNHSSDLKKPPKSTIHTNTGWSQDVLPDAKDGDWLLTEEKSLLVLNLKLMVFPLAVNTVVLEHVGLQQSNTESNQIKLLTQLIKNRLIDEITEALRSDQLINKQINHLSNEITHAYWTIKRIETTTSKSN